MRVSDSPQINMIQGDCMDAMAGMEDNAYELAIVDPEYGIGMDGRKESICKNSNHNKRAYKQKKWDKKVVSRKTIEEIIRVSENQILWGANYYPEYLEGSMGWIVWNKEQRIKSSDGELAYSSFNRALRIFDLNRGFLAFENPIHPTQKPIKLYKWLLTNYANESDRILDTHGGSGSIAIACYDMGFDLDWYELDKDYYADAVERFKEHKKQGQLFRPKPKPQPKQGELI